MYYRLGSFGRFVWSMSVFVLWVFTTIMSMQLLMGMTMTTSHQGYHAARTVGVNPAVGDIGTLFMAVIIFFIVPTFTAAVFMYFNKKLKGTPR